MRVTSSRVVYENPWMRVHEDRTERDDGTPGLYGWVEKPPAALIVALEAGHTWLIEQLRHPLRKRFWEFPQGTGAAEGEALARAELAEETGLRAARLECLGRIYYGYGLTDQGVDVWRATGLEAGEQDLDHAEQDLIARRFPVEEVERMVRGGVIQDASSIAAWYLATR